MAQALDPRQIPASTAAFLAGLGHSDAVLEALPSDASARRYFRLVGENRLLMVDPTDPVGYAAFIRLAQHLTDLDLSAPRVFGTAPSNGLALIEDFGTATYGNLLQSGHDETALYELAIDALVQLHTHPMATDVDVPSYDMEVLLQEVTIFSQWFVPIAAPDADVARFDAGFRALWRRALAPVMDAPKALVLRDFHIDNLMLLRGRTGVKACGMLDFQDGVLGAAQYDLMSLLQDARRDLAKGLETAMLKRYLAAIPVSYGTSTDIMKRYHLLAAQRHTRIVGLFPRLDKRDGKSGYLQFMPRVMQQMQTALIDADLPEVADFVDTNLPGWRDVVFET